MLESGQVIDKHFAVEVVNFMLHAHCQQTFSVHLAGCAGQILIADLDVLGTFDRVIHAGHGQATFLTLLQACRGFNPGIHQDQQITLVFRDIDHHQTAMHIHLSRRQTDAGGLIHGFGHVGRQLT